MQRVHRSEKQMHNEHKLFTLDEKARCQVLLEISKPRNSENSENSKVGNRNWSHNFHMSPAVVPHTKEDLIDRATNLLPKSNG